MPVKKNPGPLGGTGNAGETGPSFETALDRLRAIVDELERGELTLDESIERYEEGMKLSKRLTNQLDEAEKRIERLIDSGNDDEPPATQPMELDPRAAESSEGELLF